MPQTAVTKKAKKVKFNLMAPQANEVSLVGDFNSWDAKASPMKKDKKGMWTVSISLAPGTYSYRFFVDGRWENDPVCSEFAENPFGTTNCLVRVG